MVRKSKTKTKKNKAVTQDKKELKLLQEGYVPNQTKIGTQFKGKNRIIVA